MFVNCCRGCAPRTVVVAAGEDKMLETLRAGIKAVAVGVRGSKPIPEELGKQATIAHQEVNRSAFCDCNQQNIIANAWCIASSCHSFLPCSSDCCATSLKVFCKSVLYSPYIGTVKDTFMIAFFLMYVCALQCRSCCRHWMSWMQRAHMITVLHGKG
jgi:hypothetical protein